MCQLLAELNKLKTQKEKNIEEFKDKIFALFKGVSIKTDSGDQQLEIADTSDIKNKKLKPKSEESIAIRTKMTRQTETDDKQLNTYEQTKRFNDFLNQTNEDEKDIDMSLSKKYFF